SSSGSTCGTGRSSATRSAAASTPRTTSSPSWRDNRAYRLAPMRQKRSPWWRILSWLGWLAAALVLLLLASFAVPLREWRTGRLPAEPLDLVAGGPAVAMPKRVWIDTDAACGHGETTDADDCFAILLLAQDPAVHVVGIS